MLMAVAGDTVSLTASGYRVGDEDIVMGETWIRAASEKIDVTGLTLEPGQIMLRLRAPSDGGAENPFWIARARDVHSVLVRSLFRTDAGFWSPVERGAGPCVEMPE
jgi:hypothetical protein